MSASLQETIGYHFRDPQLLALALTHPSQLGPNNQRLEFLGDSVLGAVVAHVLYEQFPNEKEGDLARRLAALVCGETLAAAAREIGLGEHLTLGLSERQSAGHENASNLEDAMEALIGAMFLDGGFAAADAFIRPRWSALAQKIVSPPKDAKTALQEWAQGRGLPVPSYELLETTGPAHAPVFTVQVTVKGHAPAAASAPGKRAAEQSAAAALLAQLGEA